METTNKVKNPVSGRMIIIGGDVYNKLISQGYKLVGNVLYPPEQSITIPKIPVINPITLPNVSTIPIITPKIPIIKKMKKENIHLFFETLRVVNPNPTTELEYTSVFELLCAVLLSAQATDVGVNKATRVLFKVANTPKGILELGNSGLEQHIKTIGLYKSKAKHLIQ